MAHTPGPWSVQLMGKDWRGYEGWNTFTVRSPQNVCLATVGDVDRYHQGDYEADAHLMAAAPELLEAARDILALLDGVFAAAPDWEDRPEGPALRAAIAKAEGREP